MDIKYIFVYIYIYLSIQRDYYGYLCHVLKRNTN